MYVCIYICPIDHLLTGLLTPVCHKIRVTMSESCFTLVRYQRKKIYRYKCVRVTWRGGEMWPSGSRGVCVFGSFRTGWGEEPTVWRHCVLVCALACIHEGSEAHDSDREVWPNPETIGVKCSPLSLFTVLSGQGHMDYRRFVGPMRQPSPLLLT